MRTVEFLYEYEGCIDKLVEVLESGKDMVISPKICKFLISVDVIRAANEEKTMAKKTKRMLCMELKKSIFSSGRLSRQSYIFLGKLEELNKDPLYFQNYVDTLLQDQGFLGEFWELCGSNGILH